jgi:hypothetical protein
LDSLIFPLQTGIHGGESETLEFFAGMLRLSVVYAVFQCTQLWAASAGLSSLF